MAWTDEMVDKLRQMWDEGKTATEIAKALGVTKNSIVGKVHRLCLTARPSPIKPKEEEIAATALESVSEVEIIDAEQPVSVSSPVLSPAFTATNVVKKQKSGGHVKLVDLDSHTCRWPLGDPRDEDFCFCGKKVRMGQTYCEEHAMMAYVKATKNK